MDYLYGLVKLARPRNAIGALIAVTIGFFVAKGNYGLGKLLAPLIIVLLMNGVATIQNDLMDIDTDSKNNRSTILLDGLCTPRAAAMFSVLLLCGASLIAAYSNQPHLNLIFVALSLVLSCVYNLRPFIASRRPLSSVVVLGICTGFLPVIYGALVASNNLSPVIIAIALACFCQRVALNLMKDFKDVTGDKETGKETFLLKFGQNITVRTSFVMSLVGLILLLSALVFISWKFIILLPLALGIMLRRWQYLKHANNKKLQKDFIEILSIQNIFDGSVLACLLIF